MARASLTTWKTEVNKINPCSKCYNISCLDVGASPTQEANLSHTGLDWLMSDPLYFKLFLHTEYKECGHLTF